VRTTAAQIGVIAIQTVRTWTSPAVGVFARPGEQQICIIFDEPVSLHRTELRFDEANSERTQEFTLRSSSASGGPATEIIRQQWNSALQVQRRRLNTMS
jgi:hypothetical protein